jgi:hypothetical protein
MTQAIVTRTSQGTASVRTALVLALVALMLFSGIIVEQCFGSPMIGLGALGFAFIGLPLAAMVGRIRA